MSQIFSLRDVQGGLDQNPPVVEIFGKPPLFGPPLSPREAGRKFLGFFLGNFLENFVFFREISGIFGNFQGNFA